MTLAEVARVVDGTVHGPPGSPELTVSGAAYVDNRDPVPDGLFVAIAGERVDGHQYAAGAHAVLGSRPTEAPTVVVADVTVALGRLARHVVDRLSAGRRADGAAGLTVLALTGSQGKTSTKDLLAQVLAASAPTVATAANNNNELGVPLTVLRADESTRHLVVEMGARGIGHIAYLCDLAPPRVAAVLNVGTAHVGEFGGQAAIAAAKGEIVEALPADGTAVLNAGDPLVAAMAPRTAARVLTFGAAVEPVGDPGGDPGVEPGVEPGPGVAWRDVVVDDLGRASFDLGHDGAWVRVTLRQTGRHHVANAAAAAAMALAAGLGLDEVAAGLGAATSASRWRMELTERPDGLLVVNDAYNANPASTCAALDALADLGARRTGRTIAVLGEMLELGDEHDEAHRGVGRHAAATGTSVLVVVGERAGGLAEGAAGSDTVVIVTAGREDAAAWVRENAGAADAVLVKASRGAALEWVADQLLTTDPSTEISPETSPEGRHPAR